MSNIEPDNQFVSEEELRALLQKWQSPEPSGLLDKRVSSSYRREMIEGSVLGKSLPLSKTDNEVVTMKFCSRCQEEFADKFSFCPVDGTPLDLIEAQHDERSLSASPNGSYGVFLTEDAEPDVAQAAYAGAGASHALAPRGEYH